MYPVKKECLELRLLDLALSKPIVQELFPRLEYPKDDSDMSAYSYALMSSARGISSLRSTGSPMIDGVIFTLKFSNVQDLLSFLKYRSDLVYDVQANADFLADSGGNIVPRNIFSVESPLVLPFMRYATGISGSYTGSARVVILAPDVRGREFGLLRNIGIFPVGNTRLAYIGGSISYSQEESLPHSLLRSREGAQTLASAREQAEKEEECKKEEKGMFPGCIQTYRSRWLSYF